MPGLATRLKRLETMTDLAMRPHACPECGRLPNGRMPTDGSVRLTCSMEGSDPDPAMPDYCGACGGQRVYRLTFDDRG